MNDADVWDVNLRKINVTADLKTMFYLNSSYLINIRVFKLATFVRPRGQYNGIIWLVYLLVVFIYSYVILRLNTIAENHWRRNSIRYIILDVANSNSRYKFFCVNHSFFLDHTSSVGSLLSYKWQEWASRRDRWLRWMDEGNILRQSQNGTAWDDTEVINNSTYAVF